MFEFTTTRHNPLIDPVLATWTWEIPVYLFVGGAVAGLMILGGAAMLRVARGEAPERFASVQAPLLALALISVGMLALLLDLSHRWYAWRVFMTLQPLAPMSWGSWTLLLVCAVLVLSLLVRLPQSWPWLTQRVALLAAASQRLATPRSLRWLGIGNIVFGLSLGTYTGLLLNTMVARPLWNSAVLPLLFLFSGLCAGSALLYVVASLRGTRAASTGLIGGALGTLVQPLGEQLPAKATHDGLIRANVAFLVVEVVLLALFLANLATSSASHAAALQLLTSGPFAGTFWGVDVALLLLLPLVLQALMLAGRLPRTVVPALMVVAGSYTLRWLMVNAGQMSQVVATTPWP